ncbi:hypothetical protein D3C87_1655100 [compost metagenome]
MQAEAHADAHVGHFLGDDRRMAEVAAATAVLFRQRGAQQAFAAGLLPGLAVDDTVGQPGFLTRQTFALQETAHGGAELLVIFTINVTNDFHADSPVRNG